MLWPLLFQFLCLMFDIYIVIVVNVTVVMCNSSYSHHSGYVLLGQSSLLLGRLVLVLGVQVVEHSECALAVFVDNV